jgi:hypothetical protein
MRTCEKCGKSFKPAKFSYSQCPDCYVFVPPATYKQSGYVLFLANLLKIEPPDVRTPKEAADAIDRLLVLASADPDIVECATEGCHRLVDRRRRTVCRSCAKAQSAAQSQTAPQFISGEVSCAVEGCERSATMRAYGGKGSKWGPKPLRVCREHAAEIAPNSAPGAPRKEP